MSTIKNDQISLYYHFNKIKENPGTSFQSPALNQKLGRIVCHIAHQYLTKSGIDNTWDSKEISITVISVTSLCSNVYNGVTDFYICESHENTEIQISLELNIFSQIKKNH